MPFQFSKDRKTVLVSNSGVTVSSVATSFGVASTAVADFPTGPRVFEVQSTGESLLVTAGFGTTAWSGITRGINGTTAATILDNSVLLEITGANEFASFVQQGDAALTNVRSIKKTGASALTGDVTLTGGANVTLTQAGQDITIASTGGGGGGSGTVTSVGLSLPADIAVSGSPVTGAGTITAVRNVQSANAVFAGPTTGSPASPTYRALVQADIPALDASQITTGALAKARQNANTAYTDVATAFAVEVTVPDLKVTGLTGSVQAMRVVGATASGAPTTGPHLVGDASLSLADGKWYVCTVAGTPGTFVSAAGSGTVTSVGVSVPSALLNVSGSPVTGSGTFAVSLATQSANTVLAGPTTGSAATPTMRALVAADLPDATTSPISVRTYGAVGDGTTDDTTAITNAIAALTARGGGELVFPYGIYKTSGGFTISVPCLIRGHGRADADGFSGGASTILCTSATASLFTVTALSVTFEDLALKNTFAGTPTAGAGVTVAGSSALQSVHYDRISVYGFYINVDNQTGQAWTMTNCLIVGPVQYGVRLQNTLSVDAGGASLTSTNFFADAYDAAAAIRIESGGGVKILDCTVVGSQSGLHHYHKGIDRVTSCSTGVFLVSNCSIEGVLDAGINLVTTGGEWKMAVLSNLEIATDVGDGIVVSAGTSGQMDYLVISNAILYNTSGVNPAIILTNINHAAITGIVNRGFASVLSQTGCSDIQTGGGSVTSVTGTAPIAVATGATTPVISIADFIASGASHAAGAVPDPGSTAGTTKFLREDATFAVPPSAVIYGPLTDSAQNFMFDSAGTLILAPR